MSHTYHWDEEQVDTLANRCTHIMLGLMGLALMVMMMDIGSVYLLAPGLIIVLITRKAQHYYEQLQTQFENSQLQLSPRTLAIQQPATGMDKRIRYQDIQQLETFKKWGISGIRLHLAQNETVELCGYPQALEAALNTAIKEQQA